MNECKPCLQWVRVVRSNLSFDTAILQVRTRMVYVTIATVNKMALPVDWKMRQDKRREVGYPAARAADSYHVCVMYSIHSRKSYCDIRLFK